MQGGNSFEHDEKHENQLKNSEELIEKSDYYNSDEWVSKRDVKRKFRNIIGIGVILVILTSILSVYIFNGFTIYIGRSGVEFKVGKESIKESAKEHDTKLSYVDDRLRLIYDKIYEYYDGKIDSKALFEKAYEGMILSFNEEYAETLSIENIEKDYAEKNEKAEIKDYSNLSKEEREFKEFSDRMKLLYNKIQEIHDRELFDGAYKGMVEALEDPYSGYLNEEDYRRLSQETSGSYVGLGITVGVIEDNVVVISPFKDSPADKAGLLPGDIINKVNNIEIGKDIDKAVGMMKGKEGGKVTLNIIREGTEPFDVDIIRAEIKLQTVGGEMIDENIGYIGITMFSETTSDDFKNKLNELKEKGAEGLILDLRGNPGGLVSACTEVASNFIPKGKTIVYTVDKYDNERVYKSQGGIAQDIPTVVLIDKGSASASEILSGALRDYDRATLIGEKSFGKGIVQTILSRKIDGFGDGTALKLTVSKYYTPEGENIHKKGIMPEIEVVLDEENFKRGERETDNQYQKALEVIKGKIGN
ncbi:S41 family peptidase [Oceanirhabdus sp. W0125-5]|uniref:S41 family peptidase n=1 Tax=Oceanirhabdus sp. W0125-5 TaxID=2999116 RepID=UPI0022F2B3A2|nr:S41 family peptidase [Oceanirhabdus sp. W0125-5]WBW99284.1 S41 family peptidase [Oceanirhabdus sp. W0125-5]